MKPAIISIFYLSVSTLLLLGQDAPKLDLTGTWKYQLYFGSKPTYSDGKVITLERNGTYAFMDVDAQGKILKPVGPDSRGKWSMEGTVLIRVQDRYRKLPPEQWQITKQSGSDIAFEIKRNPPSPKEETYTEVWTRTSTTVAIPPPVGQPELKKGSASIDRTTVTSRSFQVSPDFLDRMSRIGENKRDTFADDSAYLKEMLVKLGLSFPNGTSVTWKPPTEIVIQGNAGLLKQVEEIITEVSKPEKKVAAVDSKTPTPTAIPAPSPTPPPAGPLVWTSRDGKSVRGDFIRLVGEAVVIKRDGKEFTIPFTRLDPVSVSQANALEQAATGK